jgi:hypothetical protein
MFCVGLEVARILSDYGRTWRESGIFRLLIGCFFRWFPFVFSAQNVVAPYTETVIRQ